MGREYNLIYSKLVEREDDVVGTIAYSIYKTDKIAFIEDYKNKHEGQEPTEDDFRRFHEMICTDGHINRYQMQAINVLNSFLNDTLSETAAQIDDDCKNRHSQMLRSIVEGIATDIVRKQVPEIMQKQLKPIKPKGFWYGVGQSVLGAFVFMLLACGLIFMATLSQKEYTFTIGGSGSATIEEKALPDSLMVSNSNHIETTK